MSEQGLTRHPSPERGKVSRLGLAFAVWGGPAAWYVQLNVNYGLTATACFPGPQRNLELPPEAQWTYGVALAVYLILLLVAVASGFVAIRLFRRTGGETVGSRADVEEAGTGRTRFLTYWGMLLGFGFALVILINLAGLLMVPQCAM